MSELADDLETSADGALVVDEDLKIVYANRSAQRILGYHPDGSAYGYCYQIMRGRDDRQQLVCREYCLVARRASLGEPVSNFDLNVPTKIKGDRWLNMSVLHYSDKSQGSSYIVHLFRDITQKKRDAEFAERLIAAARQHDSLRPDPHSSHATSRGHERLTPREREVLTLLAEGHGTREIAQRLSISTTTTRNHIQHVLQKLNVHTRLEAVVHAMNNDLFE